MKALVFAAGLGTRLKPLTDSCPKALVSIAGKTLLDHTIQRLEEAGATEIVVNIHHFGEHIIAYLNAHDYKARVSISDERSALLDTGGGLRQALPLFSPDEEPILIHNVDILHNADLTAFYDAAQENDITLMVSRRDTTRYLLFDDEMRLVGWTNIQTGEVRSPRPLGDISRLHRYAFSGIHCVSPRIAPLLNDFPEKFPIMDFYLSKCNKIRIKGHLLDDLKLLDVGKLDSLAAAKKFIKG